MTLPELLTAFLALGGVAVFIAAGINVLKFFHIIPDGSADLWSLVLNAVLFLFFVVGKAAGVDVDTADKVLGGIGQLILILLPLLGQVLVGRLAHATLKRLKVPVLGYSYTKG
jgi:hypothetical protein